MRVAASVLFVVLVLFTLVQYNDPDALVWMAIYGLAAFWNGVAAFRPTVFTRPIWRRLAAATLALSAVGVVYYWPKTPGWWRQDVWWETETAREGMGIMIVFLSMILVWFASRKAKIRVPASAPD